MRTMIAAAGIPPSEALFERYFDLCDMLIAADGGIDWLMEYGAVPDVFLGDMDSTQISSFDRFKGVERFVFPAEKDESDLELAIRLALERGATNIALLGATGKRTDHAYCNLMLLLGIAQKGLPALIADDFCVMRFCVGELELRLKDGETFSLLPFCGDVTVSIEGDVKYPVKELRLRQTQTLGLSNVMLADGLTVRSDGCVLVVQSRAQGAI